MPITSYTLILLSLRQALHVAESQNDTSYNTVQMGKENGVSLFSQIDPIFLKNSTHWLAKECDIF